MQARLPKKGAEADKQTIGEMISDCNYTLEWLETGRRPGNRRGIERRAAYQRERPVDPIVLQTYIRPETRHTATVSEEDRQRIENILGRLTPRERECYVMVIGSGLSYAEAAELVGVAKGSVQSFVDSAKKKIQKILCEGDLFDFM
jgi:RNA polymerase sigma-70 factor (ECF subfamily)